MSVVCWIDTDVISRVIIERFVYLTNDYTLHDWADWWYFELFTVRKINDSYYMTHITYVNTSAKVIIQCSNNFKGNFFLYSDQRFFFLENLSRDVDLILFPSWNSANLCCIKSFSASSHIRWLNCHIWNDVIGHDRKLKKS